MKKELQQEGGRIEQEEEFLEKTEVFRKFFPDGSIEQVDLGSVPEAAMNRFEGASKRFILPEEYHENNFEALYVIRHEDGDETWVARQTKNLDEGLTEHDHYLADFMGGEEIGHGEIRCLEHGSIHGLNQKPFVGYTNTHEPPKTKEDYRKRGFGMRRLLYMNGIAQMEYSSPLYSGAHPAPEARRLWERLVAQGKAKKIRLQGEDYERFVFTE